ncbi:MAG: hypothetical protein V8Q27_09855 [Eubacteriales bacterium]
MYTRAALGEYSAMAFLPLALYGFCSIFSDYSGKKNWMALAMGVTGLLETHMLSTEMAAMLAGVLCLDDLPDFSEGDLSGPHKGCGAGAASEFMVSDSLFGRDAP